MLQWFLLGVQFLIRTRSWYLYISRNIKFCFVYSNGCLNDVKINAPIGNADEFKQLVGPLFNHLKFYQPPYQVSEEDGVKSISDTIWIFYCIHCDRYECATTD